MNFWSIDWKKFLLCLCQKPWSCDTTSAVQGNGKTSLVWLFQKNQDFQEACKTSMNKNIEQEAEEAGCLVFVLLYGVSLLRSLPLNTLSHLWYISYKNLAATTQKLLPEKLPPSEVAVKSEADLGLLQHSRRRSYNSVLSQSTPPWMLQQP